MQTDCPIVNIHNLRFQDVGLPHSKPYHPTLNMTLTEVSLHAVRKPFHTCTDCLINDVHHSDKINKLVNTLPRNE